MRTHLRCWMELPGTTVFGPAAQVHLAVEDVSLADALAPTALHRSFAISAPSSSELTLGPYELDLALPPPRGHYALRVHVDISGDGRIAPGDYVSTAHHPIPPGLQTTELRIPVTCVPFPGTERE